MPFLPRTARTVETGLYCGFLPSIIPHIILRKIWGIFCALLVFAGTATAQVSFVDHEAQVRQIFSLISKRLQMMESVAAWKYAHHMPVLDAAREQSMLEAVVTQAKALGISEEEVRRLFSWQMRVARELQQRFIDQWRDAGIVPTELKNLYSELRPQLDALNVSLLQAIYLAMPEFERKDFQTYYAESVEHIASQGVFNRDIGVLFGILQGLRTIQIPALQRISASKMLRIGTTGDYAPFTFESRGVLTGADIAAAISLATFLGVEAHFIRTTWPALMTDYKRERFDIAIGGISVTADRTKIAAFSIPYLHGGKTPIVRCGTEAQFNSLAKIDQAGVNVIVNPGGTNERFVRTHLRNVQPIIHSDNRTVFEEIATGRADVMVTDDVEVELQAQCDARLCRATAEFFMPYEKAVLLSRDAELIAKVNTWLNAELENGEVVGRLDAALLHESALICGH